MLVASFLQYLSSEKKYSSHTILAYKKDIEQFADFFKGNFQEENLTEVNYPIIRHWIVNLTEQKITANSINRKMASLKAFYKFLLKIGEIQTYPLQKHKSLKVQKKVQIPFSQKELTKALDWIEYPDTFEGVRNRAIIMLLYTTGIRRAELISLSLGSIDFYKNSLKVAGKRNKQRIVPLAKDALSAIKLYLNKREKIAASDLNNWLFVTSKGEKIYPSLVYRIINLYLGAVSSKAKRSPHILRHTFATHLLEQGADLNSIKELLGHASLSATQVYTHNSIAKLKEAHKNAHPRNQKTNE